MSLINVSNLSFGYDGSYVNVFENVSFQIDTGWRLGFTGRNGRGKTTFLKLLMGDLEYSGDISHQTKFEYFPYEVKGENELLFDVIRHVGPKAQDWEIMREISLLGLSEDSLYRPFHSLSKGEQTKALLAAMFLRENSFLLIDEPTNHLDAEGRRILANYLKSKKGFILVSHDRVFLDSCIDHILSINKTNIEIQKGNFSSWLKNKELSDGFEFAENEKRKKEIGRLEEAAQRASGWSDKTEKGKYGERNAGLRPDRGYVGHKAAKMMKHSKSIEGRRQTAIEEKSRLLKNLESSEALKILPLRPQTRVLIELRGLRLYYGGRQICEEISFSIEPGDRIALRGENGSGKSSMLKLLCGEPIAFEGSLWKDSGLQISYVPQSTKGLKGGLKDYARENLLDESLFKSLLRKLDFSREQFDTPMENFSEGQKKKTLIAKSLCERAHLYIWDEPLNYIDVLSRMQIESLLLEYKPTILFVEHDAAFCENAATKILTLSKFGKAP